MPTLSAAREVAAVAGDPQGDDAQRHIAGLVAAADAGVRLAYEAGVRMAFGTDAGVIPHGSNAGEFRHLVHAGVPPREALKMATVNAAELLGLASEIGTIAPGKNADLIAVDASPLADIGVLERVSFVMKAGAVVELSK